MNLKNNTTFSGLIFVFFFVLQQIIAFTSSFYLISIYWLPITVIIFIININLPITQKRYHSAFVFMIICIIGSFMSFLKGATVGSVLVNSLYALYGFIGYVYITNKRINLRVFDVLLIILYIFFYLTFFSFNVSTRAAISGNVFGHSSSNTIAICLNITLFIYYLLNKNYNGNSNKRILIFAIINLILIVIQGSRMGVVIAFILLIFSISDLYSLKSTPRFYLSFLVIAISLSFIVYKQIDQLQDILDIDKMQGVKSYQEDVRSRASRSFFEKMDYSSFFVGYPSNFEFTFGITRTFNAFLDFWNSYGLLPFIFLLYFLIKRIIFSKIFSVPLLVFFPLLLYSLVESLWGGNLWDILIYIVLFYSNKEEGELQIISKN